jgi:hypothetical protein
VKGTELENKPARAPGSGRSSSGSASQAPRRRAHQLRRRHPRSDVLRPRHREVGARSRGSIKWALDTRRDTKVVVTANTEKQLQTKTWPELAKWHRLSITAAGSCSPRPSLYSIDPKHEKTWRADAIAWSEHNTEAFAGLHNEGRGSWSSSTKPRRSPTRCGKSPRARSPTRTRRSSGSCSGTARARPADSASASAKSAIAGNARTSTAARRGHEQAQLEQWVEDYGEDSDFVKVRVRGMFPAASLKQFISETDVDAAWGKQLKPEQYQFAPVILTSTRVGRRRSARHRQAARVEVRDPSRAPEERQRCVGRESPGAARGRASAPTPCSSTPATALGS